MIALVAGLVAAVFAQPAGAQAGAEPDSSLGAAATLSPYKTVSIPTGEPVTDVEQSALDYPLVAAGRDVYIYGVSGLFIGRFGPFEADIRNIASAGGDVFVHEGPGCTATTVPRWTGSRCTTASRMSATSRWWETTWST